MVAHQRSVSVVLSLMLAAALNVTLRAKDQQKQIDWLPVTPEELALKDNPAQPGAAAMVLYRETDTDSASGIELNYYRVKILKEEGKKYADVSLQFSKGETKVEDIEARTIRPDGKIVEFDGDIYEKVVARHKQDVNYLSKTFTLADVQVGSIIEYKYAIKWKPIPSDLLQDPSAWLVLSKLAPTRANQWIVQDDLFTRRAHFSFTPGIKVGLNYTWFGLPPDAKPLNDNGTIKLDVKDVPAFEEEEYMPPQRETQARVDFFYVFNKPANADPKSSDWFWKDQGKRIDESVEKFIGKHKGVDRQVNEWIAQGDSADTKLQKLYQQAQAIRNLSFEREKTEKEEKREKLKDNQSVEDVLKHGYGEGDEINELFVAMARGAGFDAYIVEVPPRNSVFFSPILLDVGQFRGNIVEVDVEGKPRFFDPATPGCPYNLIPWEETGIRGLRLQEDGGVFVNIPGVRSNDAIVDRKLTVQMDAEGALQGKVQVKYVGEEGLIRRLANRGKDDAERRKYLEDEMKDWLPSGSTAQLASTPNWDKTGETLQAEFTVKIPAIGTTTGRRMLVPPAVFQASMKYPFQSEKRIHPVYIHYPYQEVDEVIFQLPKEYQQESLPKPKSENVAFGRYEISYMGEPGSIRMERRFSLDGIFYPVNYYPALRSFFNTARAGDEQQMVLKATGNASAQ